MQAKYQLTVEQDVKQALIEDLGGSLNINNDITAMLIDKEKTAQAQIIAREPGVLCGKAWTTMAFSMVDSSLKINWLVDDGDAFSENQTLVQIIGNARAILTAERTALNFLQMLSGTATMTQRYVKLLGNSNTKLLDTRKTIPYFRHAQKYAVFCGGGQNHRMGLFDAFLIKENHIKSCGDIKTAVDKARLLSPGAPVEVEVESLEELSIAIQSGCDIIMLDNFNNQQIQKAVEINNQVCKLEVSGNITDDRLQELANLGVDYVSSGALTKNVKAIDLSLLIQ
ncbi:carboxylating nicotinate-nucleotide diphosphorylase [Glaciecola sp. 1036]|uniref:carboxylating nicotinate-nucleotide diphosphorylase n=1 Tax=Alteromonadaceae TaxID=72275 RepID=UPI003D065E4E